MNIWGIILAAGRGSRLAGHCSLPKQFLPYRGAPLFWRSALTMARLPGLRGLVFVLPPDETGAQEGDYQSLISGLDSSGPGGPLGLAWRLAEGGDERQDSVASGLAALPDDCEAVLIHDGARPFASPALMQRVLGALLDGSPAVVPGIDLADTVKLVDDGGGRTLVRETLERAALRAVQTPQGFALPFLRKAHATARAGGWRVTDDAALMERLGLPVLVVEGEEENRKITTPGDLALLRRARTKEDAMPEFIPCTGFGYDVHRFGGKRPLKLGGVPIPCDLAVAAHSDGDVLLHALMDALLGCFGGGDIGLLFPDSDPAFENIAGGVLLAEVLERARAAGVLLTHVDLTVITQIPRIAPHRAAIAANVATLLELPAHAVNVKATTEEGLGFTGEKKGLKAVAVVSALRPASPRAGEEAHDL